MKKLFSFLLAGALILASTLGAQAQPIIYEVGEVSGQATPSATPAAQPAQGANHNYLPALWAEKCYGLTQLGPMSASGEDGPTLCALLKDYTGTQGLEQLIARVDAGHTQLFATDLPQVEVTVPFTSTQIGPQNQTQVFAGRIQITSVSFITGTETSAASVADVPPLTGRIMWVIIKALQEKTASSPVLFPVSIATLHYSSPGKGNITTIFDKCGDILNAGQLALPGYPYDMIVGDASARGGSAWLAMRYPACPAMNPTPYIKLTNFWSTLKVFPQYSNIDNEAAAILAGNVYHVDSLTVRDPAGDLQKVGAVVIALVAGPLVVLFVIPELAALGGAYYIVTGTAVLSTQP